jgi:hypothetical protein
MGRLTKKVFIGGTPYFIDTKGNDILAKDMTVYQIGVALERLAAYEDTDLTPEEFVQMRREWRDTEKHLRESLRRKCNDEQKAVRCICDIETYLDLNSPKYIKETIDTWRTPKGNYGTV